MKESGPTQWIASELLNAPGTAVADAADGLSSAACRAPASMEDAEVQTEVIERLTHTISNIDAQSNWQSLR